MSPEQLSSGAAAAVRAVSKCWQISQFVFDCGGIDFLQVSMHFCPRAAEQGCRVRGNLEIRMEIPRQYIH